MTLSGVNVTTSLTVEGHYTAGGNGTVKTVNLTCGVFNDGKPAKAKQITIHWRQVSEVWVSVRIVDARNIFVSANATCSQA